MAKVLRDPLKKVVDLKIVPKKWRKTKVTKPKKVTKMARKRMNL